MADRHQRDPQPDSAPFVGREAALAELLAALSAGPALVLVEGEAGIGKTRLVGEALGDPALAGRRVLLAACPPLSEPAPLAALVDGLRRLTASPGAARLSPLGGALRPLFPEWAAALPPPPEPAEDARATRHRVVRALDELIAALGVELVVVEDVHWADPATVEWLLSTTTTTSARSLLLTYRPADLPAGAALRRLTGRASPGLTGCRIALDPLDRAGTAALVGATFGTTAVSDAFAALLHARTGGLPLALTECLRLLAERRDIVRTEAGWARRALAELAVPATVRDSVLERVERLPPAAQRLLAAAAIVAEPADEALLTTVAGLAPAAATAGLARALAAGLLDEPSPGRIAFRHVLAADAVEQALPASQRRRLHRRAGEALRSLPHPPAARLARHFRAAGQSAAWATWAEAAAELALAAGDDRAAVSLLHDVLTGLGRPARAELFGYIPLDDFGIEPIAVGDEEIVNFDSPAFEYTGQMFTSFGVDSKGYIIVGGGTAEDNNCCSLPAGPDPARPNNVLAPFWADLDGSAVPGIFVATLGLPSGERWIVVEFRLDVFGTTDERVFQTWIGINGEEDITYAYPAPQADPNGQDFLVGAENVIGQGDMEAVLPTEDLRVTSSDPVPGDSVSYSVFVEGVKMGTGVVTTEMTTDGVPGVTVVKSEIQVTQR